MKSAIRLRWCKRSDSDDRAKGRIDRDAEIALADRTKGILAILILALLLGCTQRHSTSDQQGVGAVSSSLQLRDLENLSGVAWPDVPMPRARVSITCYRLEDQVILSLDRSYLEPLIEACARAGSGDHLLGIQISYDGEIERGMADLFARIHALAKEQPTINERFWPFVLIINSPGGDALEGMLVGDVISERNWRVHIRKEQFDSINGRCYSACVLVLAAATYRDDADLLRRSKVMDAWLASEWAQRNARPKPGPPELINDDTSIGIHRLFMAGSEASSIAELQLDLEDAIETIGDYLVKHGVSRSLANDMMAIPSNDVRILTIDEVNRYGLGAVNSAKADMERLELTRMCGADYVSRREEFLRRKKLCLRLIDATEASLTASTHCIDDAKVATGLPEASCPDWIFPERSSSSPVE